MDEHNLAVRDARGRVLGATTLAPGQTRRVDLNLPSGTYTLFCSLFNHEQLGMSSTLIVR
jgi:plastocyanin